ncbi:MAG: SDR family NAD(P)-dependent oxidoreductase [Thermoanaerobaculia bacterium]
MLRMIGEFAGRVAIVTGASSGIGLKAAQRLVEEGARVTLVARSAEKLAAIAAAKPEVMLAVAGDVADPDLVERMFAETEFRFGSCDLLINNAGSIEPKLLTAMSDADWDRTFDVNIRALFLACRRALPNMIAAQRGAIVNVSSISGVIGPQKFPGFTAYCASKGAVISFTEALAAEVKETRVRVNCVSPGSVDTPMLRKANEALTPDMSAAEVADTILYLASDRSRPINGQNLHVFSV